MNATEKLRLLLDEREVEYEAPNYIITMWAGSVCSWIAIEDKDGLAVAVNRDYLTPEQAVEATLGRGTCHRRPHIDLTIGDNFLKQSGWDCSECGCRLDLPVIARYCPNCGRKVVDE